MDWGALETAITEVATKITEELAVEMQAAGEDVAEAAIMAKATANAREAVAERRYPSHYSEAMASADLWTNLYPVIRARALHDYSQIGMEGELSHSEGGVVRTYAAEKRRMYPVRPFASF